MNHSASGPVFGESERNNGDSIILFQLQEDFDLRVDRFTKL
jgi:hypothetical protein